MKFFYDLGSHLFEGIEKFNNIYKFDSSWKIYCFEANPHTYKTALEIKSRSDWMNNLNIEFINAAVSDQNGEINFECYFDNNLQSYTDVGSTAFELRHDYFKTIHQNDTYAELGDDYCRVETVPSICFSEFLDKNTSYGDQVIVKMDIEGSEFKTLTNMIMNNTHNLVKTFYIEWHERFWPDDPRYIEWKNNIIQKLVSSNIEVKTWW